MLISAVLLALAVGLLRRGSVTRLAQFSTRFVVVVAVAFGLEYFLHSPGAARVLPEAATLGPALNVLSFVMLIAAVWSEGSRSRWFRLAAAGIASNLLVIAANGGRMPVSATALAKAGLAAQAAFLATGQSLTHQLAKVAGAATSAGGAGAWGSIAAGGTRLLFLGDVMWLPPPFPWPTAFSVGDIVLAFGVFLAVMDLMLRRQ